MYAIKEASEFHSQSATLHPKGFKQKYLRIFALQQNPRPPDAEMLDVNTYCVRVGPYRVTYEIEDRHHRVRVFLLEALVEGE